MVLESGGWRCWPHKMLVSAEVPDSSPTELGPRPLHVKPPPLRPAMYEPTARRLAHSWGGGHPGPGKRGEFEGLGS